MLGRVCAGATLAHGWCSVVLEAQGGGRGEWRELDPLAHSVISSSNDALVSANNMGSQEGEMSESMFPAMVFEDSCSADQLQTSEDKAAARSERGAAREVRFSAIAPRTADGLVQIPARRPRRLTAVDEANRRAEAAREQHKSELKKNKRKRGQAVDDEQEEHEAGYDRRLHLNRQSAAAARVRRDTYIKELENSLNAIESENIELQDIVEALREERNRLHTEVEKLQLQLQYMVPASTVQQQQTVVLQPETQQSIGDEIAASFAAELDKETMAVMLQQYMEIYPSLLRDVNFSQPETGEFAHSA